MFRRLAARLVRKPKSSIAAAALAVVALWLLSSGLVAWALTRRVGAPYAEPPPAVAWGTIESHRLTTCDHEEIGAWLVRGDPHKNCVLVLHGNADSRRRMLPVIQLLAEAGQTVLAISLRAHGDSSGQLNDIGWGARHDVVAAVAFLRRECPGRRIFVLGRSLGAAAAIFAAGELGAGVDGYFLEQPYKDLSSAVWHRLRHFLPPLADWVAFTGMRLWATVLLPVDPERISPYQHVAKIPETVPVVFLAGSADRHAPLADVRALFDRVRSHARLVVFAGAAHVALDRYDPELYRTSLFELLNRGSTHASRAVSR
jgi:alpha-beta hydrolase superfamily lysophospholipase